MNEEEIRKMYRNGFPVRDIAAIKGVPKTTVWEIVHDIASEAKISLSELAEVFDTTEEKLQDVLDKVGVEKVVRRGKVYYLLVDICAALGHKHTQDIMRFFGLRVRGVKKELIYRYKI